MSPARWSYEWPHCEWSGQQQWFYDTLTRLHPYSSPSRCLTLPNSSTNKGQGLTLEECSATATNQRWTTSITIIPAAFNSQNSRLQSRLANPPQCIENLGYNTTNGAPLAMMPCNANATTNTNQRWRLNDTGALQLTFNSAKCLEAGGAGANGEGGGGVGRKGRLCFGWRTNIRTSSSSFYKYSLYMKSCSCGHFPFGIGRTGTCHWHWLRQRACIGTELSTFIFIYLL